LRALGRPGHEVVVHGAALRTGLDLRPLRRADGEVVVPAEPALRARLDLGAALLCPSDRGEVVVDRGAALGARLDLRAFRRAAGDVVVVAAEPALRARLDLGAALLRPPDHGDVVVVAADPALGARLDLRALRRADRGEVVVESGAALR